jgi:uncharacterized protein YjdB
MASQIQVADDHADIHATVSFVDAEGSPTTPSNPVTWASDNEAAATATADEDGMGATIHFGSPGAAIISVTTTNEAGDEVKAQGTVTVVPGDVALGTVDFGEV